MPRHVGMGQQGQHALIGSGPQRGGHFVAAAGDWIKYGTDPHPMLQLVQHRPVSAFPNGTKTDNAEIDHSPKCLLCRKPGWFRILVAALS